ncbi:TetR/AcrR family transcriptional regulator [Roseibium sp.]|uniref:TetR/AcrR family transcriptional regulator n=1 Tax=Roseibium sp. TaxID=1936156 RepID=UPI003267519F
MTRIASGLERAFAEHGFAAPSVGHLRDAAGVSLRTLYKYTPSREEMVYAALEHRNRRYLEKVFGNLPADPGSALDAIFDRVGDWMRSETTRGCLFHAAVASAPQDDRLVDLLQSHKTEMARLATRAARLPGREAELTLIIEGLTQTWPLHGKTAVESAKKLGRMLQGSA